MATFHHLINEFYYFIHSFCYFRMNCRFLYVQCSSVLVVFFDVLFADFTCGDALLAEITDYDAGTINISVIDGAERQNSAKTAWVNAMDEAVEKVVERFEEYLDIPDTVSYNHYFGWYGGETSMNGPWSALPEQASTNSSLRAAKSRSKPTETMLCSH